MSNYDPEIFKVFSFWSSVLVLKVLAMAVLTARYRFQKKIFANPGDAQMTGSSKSKVAYDDPDIERVRRAHLNDLENVVPWFLCTLIWLGTGPSHWLAVTLIKTFVIARIVHTLAYAVYPQQPARALAFFVGYGITAFQAVSTLLHYL